MKTAAIALALVFAVACSEEPDTCALQPGTYEVSSKIALDPAFDGCPVLDIITTTYPGSGECPKGCYCSSTVDGCSIVANQACPDSTSVALSLEVLWSDGASGTMFFDDGKKRCEYITTWVRVSAADSDTR